LARGANRITSTWEDSDANPLIQRAAYTVFEIWFGGYRHSSHHINKNGARWMRPILRTLHLPTFGLLNRS
jgi:hypothetical protein